MKAHCSPSRDLTVIPNRFSSAFTAQFRGFLTPFSKSQYPVVLKMLLHRYERLLTGKYHSSPSIYYVCNEECV